MSQDVDKENSFKNQDLLKWKGNIRYCRKVKIESQNVDLLLSSCEKFNSYDIWYASGNLKPSVHH